MININRALAKTYALCIAFYLNKKLSRTSLEKNIVCVDVRGGYGWPSTPAKSILKFINTIIRVIEQNFPERLAKSIVYPLPIAAITLWRLVKIFLDSNIASKIAIISGVATEASVLPFKKLDKYSEKDTFDAMESNRLSTFKVV